MDLTQRATNPTKSIEIKEVVQRLKDAGYGELVECLLNDEGECFTKKDRLNKSGTVRKLGWKSKRLEDALAAMRQILHDEFGMDCVDF